MPAQYELNASIVARIRADDVARGTECAEPVERYARSSVRSYVLISPCRDEAKHMRQTLDSVISQSIGLRNGS